MSHSVCPDNNILPKKQVTRPMIWAVFLVVGIVWGLTGPLSKIAVSTGHHSVGITLWNVGIGGVILCMLLKGRNLRLPLGRQHLIFYGICGFLGTAFPHVVSYQAYNVLPVGIMVMIMATIPMMTLFLAIPIGVERASPRRLLGLVFGCGAMAMLVLPEASLPDPELAIWILAPVLASLAYSGENVYLAKYQPKDCNSLQILLGLNVAAFAMILPIAFVTDAWIPLWEMGPAEQAILGISCLHLAAYLGFIWLIEHAGPVFAAQVSYLVIGTGVLLGLLLFNEHHSVWVWAALAIILAGLALVNPREKYETPSAKTGAA